MTDNDIIQIYFGNLYLFQGNVNGIFSGEFNSIHFSDIKTIDVIVRQDKGEGPGKFV